MMRMMGRLEQGFCPVCRSKAGSDCPARSLTRGALRAKERRRWQIEVSHKMQASLS